MRTKQWKTREKKGTNKTPEELFSKYAIPCADVLFEQGRISKQSFDELNNKFWNNEPITKQELERVFVNGFRRLKDTAKRNKLDYWTTQAIRTYFIKEHNKYIDNNDGEYKNLGKTLKGLCKVRKARVIDFDKVEGIALVEFEEASIPKRKVITTLIPDIKRGDRVSVHFAFAIERIE